MFAFLIIYMVPKMKITPAIIALCLASMVGCVSEPKSGVWASPVAARTEPIRELTQVAKQRKLYWHIHCWYWNGEGSDYSFGAEAYEHPGEDRAYIEDGGKPHWLSSGRTQEIAAAKLLDDLSKPPNFSPDHKREIREANRKRQCPEEISGSPDGIKKSKCKSCGDGD